MAPSTTYHFPPFRLDEQSGQLWRGTKELPLRPKTFAVLSYLLHHAGRLVLKDEMFATLWPGVTVGDTALAICIGELRHVLGDDPHQPRFIETVHRRGYRFIAPLSTPPPVESSKLKVQSLKSNPAPSLQPPAPSLVGREAELAQLHNLFAKALTGQRQLVFVTGEAGIGKTALVETFLQSLDASLWLGHGQCVEHYGTGEPYLPVLEALGRLCRTIDGEEVIERLREYAPSWLVQLAALVSKTELEALQRQVSGATRDRMLRELAEALETLTVARPLVLVLEDLQWSDPSTIELLAMLARRREPARLVVMGTYRAAELIVTDHPLRTIKQELVVHGQGAEVALSYLSPEAVQMYVAQRFADHAPDDELAAVVYQRTDGHPLFMVQVADYLAQQGVLSASAPGPVTAITRLLPPGLRELIEVQLGHLRREEQQVLEVGSVAGAEFVVASVAAGVQMTPDAIEEVCEGLARREQFIADRGLAEWPDGTVSGRYGFRHALYQEVLSQRLGTARQARLHRQIGERIAVGYGERTSEVAAVLAMHFEQGRDAQRAVQYLHAAAETALQRYAYHEATLLLTRALGLLKTWPDTSERAQQELLLQIALGVALHATRGYTAPEVERVYARAQELCQQQGATAQLFPVLWGLMAFWRIRAQLLTAREFAEQMLRLAQRMQDPLRLQAAHGTLGELLSDLGEWNQARTHLEQGMALRDPQTDRSHAVLDPRVHCRTLAARALWYLGSPHQAVTKLHEALALAQEQPRSFSLAHALSMAASVHQERREVQTCLEYAEAVIEIARKQGFAYREMGGMIQRGWALARQGQAEEGITQLRQGIAALHSLGAEAWQTYYLAMLAEAHGIAGQPDEGLRELTEALALVDTTGERWYEAELYRLKGQLTLQKFQVSGSKFQVEKGLASRV